MHKPAKIFTATPDGDFSDSELCSYETQEERTGPWEQTKIGIFMLLIGIGGTVFLGLIALAAYGAK